MHIDIEKKFVKLSTKEWMQYLQYKLSPERERELMDHTQYDIFLSDALESINAMEGRHLAYNSLSYIHSQIEEMTGVSGSKISNQRSTVNHYSSSSPNFNNYKIVLIVLAICAVLGIGIWMFNYFNSSTDENNLSEESLIESESATKSNDLIDSSTLPMSTIQNNSSSSTEPSMTPIKATSTSNSNVQSTPSLVDEQKMKNESLTNVKSEPNNIKNSEKEEFERAQDLYKQGKINESKEILKKLRNYDNPYKTQSETLLKNLSGQ